MGGAITVGSWKSPSPPVWSNVFRAVGTGWLKSTGRVGRVMRFHRLAPSPCRGTGRMGWNSIAPPTLESPEFTSPSAKLTSKRENNAHTSESGFESFLPVSATSLSDAPLGSCPPAAVAKETNASRLAAPRNDRMRVTPRGSFLMFVLHSAITDSGVITAVRWAPSPRAPTRRTPRGPRGRAASAARRTLHG